MKRTKVVAFILVFLNGANKSGSVMCFKHSLWKFQYHVYRLSWKAMFSHEFLFFICGLKSYAAQHSTVHEPLALGFILPIVPLHSVISHIPLSSSSRRQQTPIYIIWLFI